MQEHLDQALHNADFHKCIDERFGDKFFDWKITVTFYQAIHYIKALAAKRGIDLGGSHEKINASINPKINGCIMPISQSAWRAYASLLNSSMAARYNGIADRKTFEILMQTDHKHCLENLEFLKKYVAGQGINIPGVTLTPRPANPSPEAKA